MGPENLFLICVNGILTTVAACLYAAGGTDPYPKALRRVGSTIVLSAALIFTAIFVHRWAWQYLGVPVILAIGFSLGYGGDSFWQKLLKRTSCAIAIMATSWLCLWATGFTHSGWMNLGIIHWVGATSIVLGAANPYNNAPLEQFLICQVLNIFLVSWPFIK